MSAGGVRGASRLEERAGGWRVYSDPDLADVVGAFVTSGQTARLTHAALETLAVVAYRQPVTRGQVSAIRGVNVDSVMRTLTARGLVEEAGHDEATGALLHRTTPTSWSGSAWARSTTCHHWRPTSRSWKRSGTRS